MKIYYAHHLWKYDTEIEKYELDLINQFFKNADIINPNGFVDQTLSEPEIMDKCFDYVELCNVIVFSSMDGVVGKGVVSEVEKARSQNKDIYYINKNEIYKVNDCVFKKIENLESNRIYAAVETN